MIKDHVFKYYIGQNKSCSESLFLAACEDRNIPVTPENLKLIGAFCGGVCCGSLCGAVAAGAAVIALRTGGMDLDAHENPEMREKVKAFVTRFQEKAGSELCQNVKEKYFVAGDRCLATVELAADVLEEFLN